MYLISKKTKLDRIEYYRRILIKRINDYINNDQIGTMNLSHSPNFKLPKHLHIKGTLLISESRLQSLPEFLTIDGSLIIDRSLISSLPSHLIVKNDLIISNSLISELPKDIVIGRYLRLFNCPLRDNNTKETIRINFSVENIIYM